MKFAILIERHAQKQIMKLDKMIIPVIKKAIEDLGDNPRPYGYKKLKGVDAYRIRVGNYRIIYEIKDSVLTIVVIAIGHRKDIYK